jgi:hypothetical protein
VALNFVLIQSKDMTLDIGGNIAFNKTIIDKLGSPEESIYIDGKEEERSFYLGNNVAHNPYNVFIEGEEIGLFYGYKTDGIYQVGDTTMLAGNVPGDVKIVDMNGDGKIDLDDRTTMGNPNPDFTYGLSLNFKYKRLSLSAQCDGVYGNEIANGGFESLDMAKGRQNNITRKAYEQAWRPNAPSNTYPRIGASVWGIGGPVDRLISDGSYFRLNNLTIGYDLPLEKYVSRCHLYVAGGNLFTITNYRGYTPIITSYLWDPGVIGVDWYNPPNSRSITVGLTINF